MGNISTFHNGWASIWMKCSYKVIFFISISCACSIRTFYLVFETDILERVFLSDDQEYSYQIRVKEIFRVCPFTTFYIYLTMSVLIW